MAMVKFWRGAAAPSTRNEDTLYFDQSGKLYLGNDLIADVTTLDQDQVNELVAKALENFYTKEEIDGLLKSINDTHAADKEALEEAIALKADQRALETVDAKFANYNTTAAQKLIDDAQDVEIGKKQDQLTTEQLAAVNSGITAEKVSAYDEVKTTVDNFFSSDAAIEGAIDTLKEIAEYIASDEEGAADITASIGAIQARLPDGTIADTDDVDAAKLAAVSEAGSNADTKIATALEAYETKAIAEGKYEQKANLKALAYKDSLTAAEVDAYTKAEVDAKVKEVQNDVDAIDTGVMSVVEGTANGTIKVDGTDVAVHGLGSAAYTDSTAYDAAGTGAAAAAAVQGDTTNTVKDCVDAINTMNSQVGSTIGTVNDIVAMLTWIEG